MSNFINTVANWYPLKTPLDLDNAWGQFTHEIGPKRYRIMGHRHSGCAYANNLFTLQARPSNDAHYYLDLQNNPYYATEDADLTLPTTYAIGYDNADSGDTSRAIPVSFQLGQASINKGTDARFITAAVSGNTGAAYATWIEVPNSSMSLGKDATPPLNVWPIQVTTGADSRPTVVQPNPDEVIQIPLLGEPTLSGNIPRDLCCTQVGSLVVYFISYWNDPTLYYFTFDGENVSEMVALTNLGAGDDGSISEIWSMDATTVYAVTDSNTPGSSPESIAVAACVTQNQKSRLITQLYQVAANNPEEAQKNNSQSLELTWLTTVKLPEPEAEWDTDAVATGTSIRIGWGSPWAEDQSTHPIKNGLMVNHAVVTSNTKYIQQGSTDLFITCVDFNPSTGPADAWQQIDQETLELDANYFIGAFSAGNYVKDKGQFVPNAMAYSLFLAGVGFDGGVAKTYAIQWPSFRLIPQQSNTPDAEIFNAHWTEDQFRAAVPSWTLLGVIAGVPPVREGSGLQVSLSVGKTSTTSGSTQISADTVFGFSAQLGSGSSIGGGFSNDQSASNLVKQSFTTTTELSHSFNEGQTITANNTPYWGRLIYLVPTYHNQQFLFNCYDGSDVPGSPSLNALSVTSSNTILELPFNLANMNTPVEGSNEPAALLQVLSDFPDSTKSWPTALDVDKWSQLDEKDDFFIGLTGVDAQQLNNNPVKQNPDKVNIDNTTHMDDFAVFEQDISQTQTSKNTVNVDASLDLPVFNIGGNFSQSSSTSVTMDDKTDFQVKYSVNAADNDDSWATYQLGAVMVFAEASDLWWVPTVSRNQRPWLLTWNVKS